MLSSPPPTEGQKNLISQLKITEVMKFLYYRNIITGKLLHIVVYFALLISNNLAATLPVCDGDGDGDDNEDNYRKDNDNNDDNNKDDNSKDDDNKGDDNNNYNDQGREKIK